MNFLLKNTLFFVLILGIFAFIQYKVTSPMDIFYSIQTMYFFHGLVAIVIFVMVYLVHKYQAVYTGYSFLVGTTLQMLACVVFLIPLMEIEKQDKISDILSFFMPYFICLVFETFFAVKLLNSK